MKANLKTVQLLEKVSSDISNLVGMYFGIIIMEAHIVDTVHNAPNLEIKNEILENAQEIVTGAREEINNGTETNKELKNYFEDIPYCGIKMVALEHVALRVHLLVKIEAYIISLESKINEMKNEI